MSEESGLLETVKFDPQYNYGVELSNQVYEVRVVNASNFWRTHIDCEYLYLNKVLKSEKMIWKPRIINPFAKKKIEVEELKTELCLYRINIARNEWGYDGFDKFYDELNNSVSFNYKSVIPFDKAKAIFGQAYEHYAAYLRDFNLMLSRSSCKIGIEDENEIKSGGCENE